MLKQQPLTRGRWERLQKSLTALVSCMKSRPTHTIRVEDDRSYVVGLTGTLILTKDAFAAAVI
jgi:hypothetical protein